MSQSKIPQPAADGLAEEPNVYRGASRPSPAVSPSVEFIHAAIDEAAASGPTTPSRRPEEIKAAGRVRLKAIRGA